MLLCIAAQTCSPPRPAVTKEQLSPVRHAGADTSPRMALLAHLTQPDAVLCSGGDQSAASHPGIFSLLILTVFIMYQFYLYQVVNGLKQHVGNASLLTISHSLVSHDTAAPNHNYKPCSSSSYKLIDSTLLAVESVMQTGVL